MKDLTLLILAGGMGSRFGGLKQVEPFGPNDEFIIDYSIYDAIASGFTKVVFLIKEENYDLFKETIGSRVEGKIPVEYAFQSLNDIPEGYTLPSDRTKPLGTAQAVYACRNVINEPFLIINADDFYGRDAFIKAANYLRETTSSDIEEYCMVGYQVKNTMTENGSVKRGYCKEENGFLTDVIESSIETKDGKIIASPLNGDTPFEINENDLVSMNMFGFNPTIFNYIKDKFPKFLDDNKDNLETCEFLIPDIVKESIDDNFARVKVLDTTSVWYGVTYKEDTPNVKESIKKLIDNNEYPNNLWD